MKNYLITLLIIFFIFEGCSKKVITRKYYLLEFPSQPDTSLIKESVVNGSCEILPVSVPPAFAQSRIAVRIRSHEVSYYQNHQWAVTPSDMLTKLVETQIQAENIFSKASQTVWKFVPQYQIQTKIDQIEAVDLDDDLYAHLTMKIDLFDRSENGIIVSHKFERLEILEERDINLLAKNLSDILKEEILKFTEKIKIYFTSNL